MASGTSPGGGVEAAALRARFLFPRCASLRAGKGLTKRALASLAGVDTTTLSKIERQEPVTIETAMLVFNAINKAHEGRLSAEIEVVTLAASAAAT